MKIEINKVTMSELVSLNGIGKAKAERIITYRKIKGPFNKLEDVMKVKGIGDNVFSRIRKDITIEKGTKITFNPDEYNLGNLNEVHLVGEMNDWQPADKSYALKKQEDGSWTGIFDLEPGSEYKFMYDSESWEEDKAIGDYNGQNLVV